jgi:hypothetical protein
MFYEPATEECGGFFAMLIFLLFLPLPHSAKTHRPYSVTTQTRRAEKMVGTKSADLLL